MPIVRVEKHQHNYLILDKQGLEDERLSFRARGLLAYLLTKPDGWDVNLNHLASQSPKEGRESLMNAIKELEASGYAHKRLVRGDDGKVRGYTTTVYETPHPPKTEVGKTEVGKTEVGKTEVGKTEVGKTEVGKTATSKDLNLVKNLKESKDLKEESPLSPPKGGTRRIKTYFPTTPQAQEQLQARVLDDDFRAWYAGKALPYDLEAQWDAFANKALANGYKYLDWRRAFMNWLTSPYQALTVPGARPAPSLDSDDFLKYLPPEGSSR